MEIRYYPDTDVLWLELKAPKNSSGKLVDDSRILHYNQDGELAAVEFLYASEGVELREVPDGMKQEVLNYIRQNVNAAMPAGDNSVELTAHLLRRAGFGATRDELAAYAAKGYAATVEELLAPRDEQRISDYLVRRFHPELSGMMGPLAPGENWLYRMSTTTAPLQEKMTLFWHGIFATGYNKVIHGKALSDQTRMFRHLRLRQLPRPVGGAVQRPGHDYLAGQPGQPQGRHQRKLRAGVAGTVLHGRGQLHRGGHQGMRPRLHRLDHRQPRVHGTALAAGFRLALWPHLLAFRVPPRRPRR